MARKSDRKFYVYTEHLLDGTTTISGEMNGNDAETVFNMIRRVADRKKVLSVGLCEVTIDADEDRLVAEEQFYFTREFTEYRFASLWGTDAVEYGGGTRPKAEVTN